MFASLSTSRALACLVLGLGAAGAALAAWVPGPSSSVSDVYATCNGLRTLFPRPVYTVDVGQRRAHCTGGKNPLDLDGCTFYEAATDASSFICPVSACVQMDCFVEVADPDPDPVPGDLGVLSEPGVVALLVGAVLAFGVGLIAGKQR